MTPSFAPGMPIWIDLGTTDLNASMNFYGRLFNWEFEDLGPEAGGYHFARIGGKMVAGVGPAQNPAQGSFWGVAFYVESADEAVAKNEAAGGKVIGPAMDVMGNGRLAVLSDPTGAIFSVWQPIGHFGVETVDEHGTFTWAELSTSDLEAIKDYYPKVLPVRMNDVDMGDGMTYTLFTVGDKNVAGAMVNHNVPSNWGVYFAVDDLDVTADQAIEFGATELMRDNAPPGRLAIMVDPQGAPFAMIKNDPNFTM